MSQNKLYSGKTKKASASSSSSAANKEPLRNVIIRAVPEHDAVAASESRPDFSVLVGLRAPPLSQDAHCAPLDLVTVIDVSSSMKGPKIDLVKQALLFVVDNLRPSDRLSIVSFATAATRILPLTKMTVPGRASAKRAVDSLSTAGGTNILEGINMGAQVLQDRTSLPNLPIASIMLLSDGHDSCNANLRARQPSDYLPASIQQTIPVHAFGFGTRHNPIVMHAISDASGGTFSFVESYQNVQAAFARCIGGLLSVVTRELRLTLKSASSNVEIRSIPSGKHTSEISDRGSRGTIIVGDLYADEEKEFLVSASVPVYSNDEGGEGEGKERTTPLLDITCSYKDVRSNETVLIDFVEIRRPGIPLPSDVKVKLEVDRQKNRLDAAEGFAEAQRAAEAGDLKGARDILSKKRSALLASESGQAGDVFVVKVEKEMKETEERMGCKQTYEKAGRAYALSNISAHANQRATSNAAGSSDDAYVTPNMANMVNKSVKIEDGDIKKQKK